MQRNFWEVELAQHKVKITENIKDLTCPVKFIYGLAN